MAEDAKELTYEVKSFDSVTKQVTIHFTDPYRESNPVQTVFVSTGDRDDSGAPIVRPSKAEVPPNNIVVRMIDAALLEDGRVDEVATQKAIVALAKEVLADCKSRAAMVDNPASVAVALGVGVTGVVTEEDIVNNEPGSENSAFDLQTQTLAAAKAAESKEV